MNNLNRFTRAPSELGSPSEPCGSMLCAERLLADLENGVAAAQWESLPALASQLRHCLELLDAQLRSIAAQLPPIMFNELLRRLADVERRHGEVVRQLLGARERIGDELGDVVQGHRAAARYLAAAEGT
jgi:hypothetical protein